MANEKKFLDSSGISHLWDRIEARYPNMDELGLIIDAIDEAKADRTDIVQADWNQNDEDAADYVKNRTHWVEESFGDIIPECTLTGSDSYFHVTPDDIENIILTNFVIDEEYTVAWNGTEYKTLGKEFDGAIILGNSGNFGGVDTGEPFFIINNDGYTIISFDSTVTTTLNLKVNGKIITVYKIDEKYLLNNNILNGNRVGSIRTIGTKVEDDTYVMGACAFAEGYATTASGENGSHAEGSLTIASGYSSHAEGVETKATEHGSHAEGNVTTASGVYSHAEGSYTTASGSGSHAEGDYTTASGGDSHAEGWNTTASGFSSHAEGYYTTASSDYQHTQGKYNIKDTEDKYAHIVGNGDSDEARSNAHTLDWEGNAWFAGTIKMGGSGQDDENAVEIATKTDLDSYEFIAVADIDEICNAVTEGSLESTDVDYLMAQLNFGVSVDELSPEEIEKLMNKLSQ